MPADEAGQEALRLSRAGLSLEALAARLGVSHDEAARLIEQGAQGEARVAQFEADAAGPPPITEDER